MGERGRKPHPRTREAVALAVRDGVTRAVEVTGMTRQQVYYACRKAEVKPYLPNRRKGRPLSKRTGRFTDAERLRYAAEATQTSLTAVARKLGVTRELVRQWRTQFGLRTVTQVNRELHAQIADECRTELASVVAKRHGLSEPTLRRICSEYGVVATFSTRASYSDEFKREVAEYAASVSDAMAGKEFGVSPVSVANWRRRFGVVKRPHRFPHKKDAAVAAVLKVAMAQAQAVDREVSTLLAWALQEHYQRKREENQA